MWVFIEITVFFTIPVISNRVYSSYNTESLIIYFIYQAMARIFIIVGIIQDQSNYSLILITLGILVKLGVFPFHVWVMPVLKGCSLNMFFLLLVPVKLPIYFLRFNFMSDLIFPVVFTIIIGVILAINQSSLLGVIAARSISSTGILLVSLNVDVFSFYFIGYSLSIGVLLYRVKFNNKGLLFFSILSLLGLPLLPLFFPKLILLVNRSLIIPFFSVFMLLSFIISSLYYVKFIPSNIIKLDNKSYVIVSIIILFSFLPIL